MSRPEQPALKPWSVAWLEKFDDMMEEARQNWLNRSVGSEEEVRRAAGDWEEFIGCIEQSIPNWKDPR